MSIGYGFEGTTVFGNGSHIDRAGGGLVDLAFFESADKGAPIKHYVVAQMTQDQFEWFVDCVYDETGWERGENKAEPDASAGQ